MLNTTKKLPTVRVNGQVIAAQTRETILEAALRAGLDFPHSCRVGGCGTCKCKVTQGRVKERTETGYLLSGEEIDDGFVLACQSVPLTDVEVAVDLTAGAPHGIPGKVIAQRRLTHDITELTVQLEQRLTYRAGQFAQVSFPQLPGVARSYSFASAPVDHGVVSFCIRKVPDGQMSSWVHDTPLVERSVYVDGPQGDFWLRPGEAPLVLVAGGSGLPAILALLEDAAEQRVAREATLLFGAREARDLYALERIASLSQRWVSKFQFVPVLSQADDDLDWQGARGLVSDHIPRYTSADAVGYLCGPPAMVDAATDSLRRCGVGADAIYCDRFVTRADTATAARAPREQSPSQQPASAPAGILHYLKYLGFHVIGLLAAFGMFGGGSGVSKGLLGVVALYILGDAFLGDDTTTPRFTHPRVLTVQLWLALPLVSLIGFAAVWSVAAGDPLGAGALIQTLTGHDALSARAAMSVGQHVATFVLTGLMIGMLGTIPAHELTHRTWDPISMWVGRWLLAFSFDTNFAIEHVYGHHRYVSTVRDPATAPRGRNVYHHIIASTIRGNVSAWRIEADRLRKKHLRLWSHHNAVLRGQLMSLLLLLAAFAMAGWKGMLFFLVCGLWGKALLEIVNYMEHYGMVRKPETPVQPRHSWNTNRRISSWTMFNLTRHSHHHAQGEVPYQDLRPYPEAPMMISGYLTTIILAMIPPLWHKLMTPKVLAWDRDYATAEERELASAANQRSGLRALQHISYDEASPMLAVPAQTR